MKNIALIAVSITAAASLATAVFYQRANSGLSKKLISAEYNIAIERSNVAVGQAALVQAREARAALETHLDRVAADAEYWRNKASDLSKKEGANESLNPYERAVLDSLRE